MKPSAQYTIENKNKFLNFLAILGSPVFSIAFNFGNINQELSNFYMPFCSRNMQSLNIIV
jgi:hypothetical protein